MKTDALIQALAADTHSQRAPGRIAAVWLLPAILAGLALLWLTLGIRSDLVPSLGVPESGLRFVLTGAVGLIGLRGALGLVRPDGRARLWPLALVGLAAVGLLAWTWLETPPGARQMAWMGKTIVACLVTIPLMSILPVAVLIATLRQGATTAPALAGFAAGLGGSGLSAMLYALHCTEDSPLFYITWYGLAMAGVTLAATLIGRRVLRW